ncbi:MAG: hypothetical protein M3342_23240 [Bacteroidota bacterium]|nr:hypothetical protein [Bacteroidota bacterium]
MKSILSLAIALVALFSVNTAVAQNPHFVGNSPCFDGSTISVHIAGLGNNEMITIVVTGTATCEQKNNPNRENQVVNDFNSSFRVLLIEKKEFSGSPAPGVFFEQVTCPSITIK